VAGLRGLEPKRVPLHFLDQPALRQILDRFNADYLPSERESDRSSCKPSV
jgi:hypothetical protein